MIPLWANPEFLRNCRAQLRPRRLLLVASVIAALSLVVGYSTYQAYKLRSDWGTTFFSVALYAQLYALCLGGGFACIRSISQEREQNTFDFQRVTQLTSLELSLGKLFGAPALAYFAALCMLPAALVGAFVGGVPLSRLAGAYLILVAGSIAVHALTLLFSLTATKGGSGIAGVAGIILIFIFLMISSSPDPSRSFFDLGTLGPSAAIEFALRGTWDVASMPIGVPAQLISNSPWTDVFFGIPVHHLPVLIVLYVTFAAWFLVPLGRNLKKDPDLLELYSPAQSVGLLCYLNVIMVGFFLVYRESFGYTERREQSFSSTFDFFLTTNLILLYSLGLALIRNREQTRRRTHQVAPGRFDRMEAGWPAAYILAGTVMVAVLVLARFALVKGMKEDLNLHFAAFQAGLLIATLLRDLCFLQWMNLRRSKRPLVLGMVLLGVFYTCGGLLLGMAKFSEPVRSAFTAIVMAWPLATADAMDQSAWLLNPGPWFIGLAFQIALAVLFAALHYKSVDELRPEVASVPARAEATGD